MRPKHIQKKKKIKKNNSEKSYQQYSDSLEIAFQSHKIDDKTFIVLPNNIHT